MSNIPSDQNNDRIEDAVDANRDEYGHVLVDEMMEGDEDAESPQPSPSQSRKTTRRSIFGSTVGISFY